MRSEIPQFEEMDVEGPIGPMYGPINYRARRPALKRQRSFYAKSQPPLKRQRTNLFSKANPVGVNQGNHGQEKKQVSTGLTVGGDTTGSITLLNGIATGDDDTNRDGRKVTCKSVLIRGQVSVGATPTSAAYRCLIVYDKQANGATPAITDILGNVNMTGMNNLNNRERFVIVSDYTGSVEATQKTIEPLKIYRKLNMETIYQSTGATITSIATGSLFFVTMGNLAAGATAPLITVNTRVRFVEK